MKRRYLILIFMLLFALGESSAQRLFRSERQRYTLRQDAMIGERSDYSRFMALEGSKVDFELPYEWLDGRISMHLDGGVEARLVAINGVLVANIQDEATPTDFEITGFLREGTNHIEMQGIGGENYIYCEPRRRIFDYEAKLQPDSTGRFAWLEIEAVVENCFNFEEPMTVGFDIYAPDGKLIDYSSRPIRIKGNSRDTVRFKTPVYNPERWSPKSPTLYHVTMLTKVGAVVESYIPVKVGYTDREFRGGELYNFGEREQLLALPFDVRGRSEQECRMVLSEMKLSGYNTLRPSQPQPRWFYEMCDDIGFYIVEQANINVPEEAHNRKVGGTPSNDPSFLGEYLDRVKSSYYRVQHHPSVIAFSMGAQSGNGYNMYKTYELLKSIEPLRPIIYIGAQGEWNSDELKISQK